MARHTKHPKHAQYQKNSAQNKRDKGLVQIHGVWVGAEDESRARQYLKRLRDAQIKKYEQSLK